MGPLWRLGKTHPGVTPWTCLSTRPLQTLQNWGLGWGNRERPGALDSGKSPSATCGPVGLVRAVTMESLLLCLYFGENDTPSCQEGYRFDPT